MNLSITEIEVNRILAGIVPADTTIEKLAAKLSPNGVVVTGEYHMLFAMSFRAEWDLTPSDGGVTAHLRELQVAGFSAGKLRGMLLKLLADAIEEPGRVHVGSDRVWIDVPAIAAANCWPFRPEVTRVQCGYGSLEIEMVVRPV